MKINDLLPEELELLSHYQRCLPEIRHNIRKMAAEEAKKSEGIKAEKNKIIGNDGVAHYCPHKDDAISRIDCYQRSSSPRPFGGQEKLAWWESCQRCEHKATAS